MPIDSRLTHIVLYVLVALCHKLYGEKIAHSLLIGQNCNAGTSRIPSFIVQTLDTE